MDLVFTMLVPFLMLAVALWGLVRRVDLWGAITDGAEKGIRVSLRIMPPLIGLLTAVYMLRAPGRWSCWGRRRGRCCRRWASRRRPSACCWCAR